MKILNKKPCSSAKTWLWTSKKSFIFQIFHIALTKWKVLWKSGKKFKKVYVNTNIKLLLYLLLILKYLINIYELICVCPETRNAWMILETTYNSQTKLIGQNLHVSEHGIGYSNLTPDPQGAWGPQGSNSSFIKSKNFANKSCQAW